MKDEATMKPGFEGFLLGIAVARLLPRRGLPLRRESRIADLSGAPIPRASISGSWSGVTTGTASGTIDATGSVPYFGAFMAQRKPKSPSRYPRYAQLRQELLRTDGRLSHDPPLTTRALPVSGPLGSLGGLTE